jgi:enoyl-CoA hydratase
MLLHARDHTVADGLDHIATWQSGMFQSADLMEGIAARAEGRDPDFPDLLPTPDSL